MNLHVAFVLAASPGALIPFVRKVAADADSQVDDAELIRSAIAGQRTAQHTLYTRHYERVHARVQRLLGGSPEVDDVLQDTFVAAFRDLEQLNDYTRFGAWLCGIAVHQVHRRLRRRRLLLRLGFVHVGFAHDEFEPVLSQTVDPAAGPELRLLLKQLDTALAGLAPRPRIAWMLRHVEGCNLEEVAEQCRTSLATVKRDINLAEAHLRAAIDDQGGPNEHV